MYAWIVGRVVRNAFAHLNRGNHAPALRLFADDAHFRFPGTHPLAAEYHRKPEIEAWFQRLLRLFPTIQFDVEDVLVKGWPWNTRVCTRFSDRIRSPNGVTHVNHGIQYLRLSWGKVKADYLYLDTQTVAEAAEHAAGARLAS
jgi:ketosteroid isomerase-like protein